MDSFSSSFSYNKLFRSGPVMVIVPHQDDEINTAGSAIYGARQEGIRVICVFLTNGAHRYKASIRAEEAIRALSVLGVPQEDIIFLGYPDSGSSWTRSPFKTNVPPPSAPYTIVSDRIQEWALIIDGNHHPSTWASLLSDLESVIVHYSPTAIIATDFDNHPDHRMCSVAVDTVIGHLLHRPHNDFFPIVLKGFAYGPAYFGAKDFFTEPLPSSRFSATGCTLFSGGTPNPAYLWKERLRLPVPSSCREPSPKRNILFRALACHFSQVAVGHASRVVNGDQIFWLRRTDNLSLRGRFTATSGRVERLCDFLYFDILPVGHKDIRFADYLWQPDKNDPSPSFRCEWDKPQSISLIRFYGAIDSASRPLTGMLTLSNGYSCSVSLTANSVRQDIVFPLQTNITSLTFAITDSALDSGIGELEIYESKDWSVQWIHPIADGNFLYEYESTHSQTSPLSAYTVLPTETHLFLDELPISAAKWTRHAPFLTGAHILRMEAGKEYASLPILKRSARTRLFRALLLLFRQWNHILRNMWERQRHSRRKRALLRSHHKNTQ